MNRGMGRKEGRRSWFRGMVLAVGLLLVQGTAADALSILSNSDGYIRRAGLQDFKQTPPVNK